MRLSRLSAVSSVFVSVVIAVACGSSGSSKKPDAAVVKMDAAIDSPAQVQNALGQLCPFMTGGGGTPCPAGNACVKITGVGSNANTGYCTPDCMGMNSICTTGYTGPSGGQPQCALSAGSGSAANGCAIVCVNPADCGTGLTCTQVTGQQVKICVPT